LVMKRATNSASMRIKNEKMILSLINKGPVSRVDIAKKTGLTKAEVIRQGIRAIYEKVK